MLQSGTHDNDLLVYWPIHDLWSRPEGLNLNLTVHGPTWMSEQPVGHTASELKRLGYAFDFVSDRMLETVEVRDGRLAAPGGDYQALLIPPLRFIPESTARRLASMARAGATVVFEDDLPEDVPGYARLEERRKGLAEAEDLLREYASVGCRLDQLPVRRETMAELGLEFVRRRIDSDTWYFVANHTASDLRAWGTLTAPFTAVAWYDPVNGDGALLPERGGQVLLQLDSGQTCILHASGTAVDLPLKPVYNLGDTPRLLSGTWRVEFIDGGPSLPEPYRTGELGSWTEAPDEAAQAFAGTARYTLEFTHEDKADDWILDLGDVRESARVRLNGTDLGVCFCLPFRLSAGAALHQGSNLLEIEVTNLSANRIRALDRSGADWRIMRDANIVNVHYQAFEPAQWPLTDSGLLGPVTLQPAHRTAPGT
jgi:hypothetical protein